MSLVSEWWVFEHGQKKKVNFEYKNYIFALSTSIAS